MQIGFKRGQKGFTLIEIIIVLAVIGVLAAVVIPNVTGFLSRGKERSWNADRDILQAAVDAWRTDPSHTGNQWPTLGGVKGTPDDANGDADFVDVGDNNSFIDFSDLVDGDYLKSTAVVKSANKLINTTATQTTSGSYAWFVNSDGAVESFWWDDADGDGAIDIAEVADAEIAANQGFQTDIYP